MKIELNEETEIQKEKAIHSDNRNEKYNRSNKKFRGEGLTNIMDYVEDRISGLEDEVKELYHSVKVKDDKFQKPYELNVQNL